MFKWRRSSKSAAYEPKTPKMPSVSLPDERYTPIDSHVAYMEKMRHPMAHQYSSRGPPPMLDAWAPPSADMIARSRSRTVSTPARDVQAPRPIRPHPSQGGFMPLMDSGDRIRREHSRGPRVPIGVPSAQYLEDTIRGRADPPQSAPMPSSHRPIDMAHMQAQAIPGTYDMEKFEHPEFKRMKDVGSREGNAPYLHPSKAYLDELINQKRLKEEAKRSGTQPVKPRPSSSGPKDPNVKEVKDFDDWEAVPLELDPKYKSVVNDKNAPLKSAMKKTPSVKAGEKPALKSAMKKSETPTESKANHSENEGSRHRREERHSSRGSKGFVDALSKAYLEEKKEKFMEDQKQKLQQIKQNGWSPHRYEARPDIRPSAFGHSHSSSTASPTESVAYDQYGRPVRSRRPSVSEPPPSNYTPAYIKDMPIPPGTNNFPNMDTSGVLSWPMIEYSLRRRDQYPMIQFDIGFDPRHPMRPVKTKRGFQTKPITREEMDIPVMYKIILPEMVITHPLLSMWPIHLKNPNSWHSLRVIDVFRAIHDMYAQPVTPQERIIIGEDYIRSCEHAFGDRCEKSPHFRHVEERRGFLRVDLLRGQRFFKGLVPIVGQPWHFQLILGDTP